MPIKPPHKVTQVCFLLAGVRRGGGGGNDSWKKMQHRWCRVLHNPQSFVDTVRPCETRFCVLGYVSTPPKRLRSFRGRRRRFLSFRTVVLDAKWTDATAVMVKRRICPLLAPSSVSSHGKAEDLPPPWCSKQPM